MKRKLLIVLLVLSCAAASAGVNVRNGNFYISYSDVAFLSSKLTITRNYNSKSVDNGYFGFGWGSLLETRLFPLPDGTVAVRWWGSGSDEYMEAAVPDVTGFYRMINAVLQAEIRRNKLSNTPTDILRRKGELRADHTNLYEQYLRNRDLGFIAKGDTYRSPAPRHWRLDTNRELSWDGHAFILRNWNERFRFNGDGLLTESNEEEGTFQVGYTHGHISTIIIDKKFPCQVQTDSAGRILRIAITDSGRVKTAEYRYDTDNNLVYSRDIENNEYWYSYDAAHDMTRIGYSDSTQVLIEYDPVTFFATKVTDRNGNSTQYTYLSFYNEWGEKDDDHYGTSVQQYDSLGQLSFTRATEYEYRERGDGSRYLHHYVSRSDTSYEDNLYDANVGNVAHRIRNGHEAWAQYDGKSRCVYLRMNDTVFRVQYNINDKPQQFLVIDSIRKDTLAYHYRYDSKGLLVAVQKGTQLYRIQPVPGSNDLQVSSGDSTLQLHYEGQKLLRARGRYWGEVNFAGEAKDPAEKERRRLALAFADVAEPRTIPHEWIWERLGEK